MMPERAVNRFLTLLRQIWRQSGESMNVQLKAFVIALAAFTVFDAAVWGGRYRDMAMHKAVYTTHWIIDQKWS